MIAALFVQGPPHGCYCGLPDVDPWPESRDARLYSGPWSVVAHPPCQRWGQIGLNNFLRCGGDHNMPGNDGGCFESALISVFAYGGVLEHPANTFAWPTFRLLKPVQGQWSDGGGYWVCEVCQSAYGHKARKRTWLLYCGDAKPPDLDWRKIPGTHKCGGEDTGHKKYSNCKSKSSVSRSEADATPIAFRDVLITLARHSRGTP